MKLITNLFNGSRPHSFAGPIFTVTLLMVRFEPPKMQKIHKTDSQKGEEEQREESDDAAEINS